MRCRVDFVTRRMKRARRAAVIFSITFCHDAGGTVPGQPQQQLDGVFQLPYVCDTYSSLLRLNELLTQAKEREPIRKGQRKLSDW